MPRSELVPPHKINDIVTVEERFDGNKYMQFPVDVEKCLLVITVCVVFLSATPSQGQSYTTQATPSKVTATSAAQCDTAEGQAQKASANGSETQSAEVARPGAEAQEDSQSSLEPTKRNLRLTGSASSDPAADPQTPQCKGKEDDAEHWHPKDPSMSANPAPASEVKATSPLVSLKDGNITVAARDARLGEILEAIQRLTGIVVDIPAEGSDERIFDSVGPAPVREALVKLLDGTKFNYVIVSSTQDPRTVKRLILTAQTSGAPIPHAGGAQGEEQAQAGPSLYGGSGFSNDETASNEPAANQPQPIDPPAATKAAIGLPANFNLQQAAAAAGKTPAQMLDELQKRQIQQLDDQLAAQGQPAQQ
jgi:hypothetical protein